ncbi:MAG: PIG-L family deacetylase [Mariniphaga sp.]|nr:PIG-L family deacetylase [Mariniphaga sp.]
MKFKTVLALSPHTDDIEFGCGGLISRLLEDNSTVYVATFSICEESVPVGLPRTILRTEMCKSLDILGIKRKNIYEFSFQVRHFPQYRQDILEDLVKLGKLIKPDLILTPSSTDIHQDHHTIYIESLRSFRYNTIFGYELPWNNISFNASGLFEISEDNLNSKIAAIDCYKSQQFRHYASGENMRNLALLRGGQNKSKYAEAFEVIRVSL